MRENTKKYFVSNLVASVVILLLLSISIVPISSVLSFFVEENNVVAEVIPAVLPAKNICEDSSAFEFDYKNLLAELKTQKHDMEEYLSSNNLSSFEKLAISNALSNLDTAIGNVEVLLSEKEN